MIEDLVSSIYQVIKIPRITSLNELLPFNEAKNILLQSFSKPMTLKKIPTIHASGHTLSQPVYSNRTNPPVLLSGPDGIAVKSIETLLASQKNPVLVHAVRVNTGMPMPEGYDAVIMIEEVTEIEESCFRIHTPVTPYQNTISQGIDIQKGDIVLDAGHAINSFDIGALLSYGILEVPVLHIQVGLIATGDEIIPLQKIPLPGQIVDSNSHMIASYLEEIGITPVFGQVVPDDPTSITEEIEKIIDKCDLVLIFGGSSAGSKDFTVDAIADGGELMFHGVGMAPGKPVSLSSMHGKPVIGMPGPSIGSLIVLYEMIYPLLTNWGLSIPPSVYVKGKLMETVLPFPGFDLFLMMKVTMNDGVNEITPVPRVFGHMMGVRANAILHVNEGSESLEKGSFVSVKMTRIR